MNCWLKIAKFLQSSCKVLANTCQTISQGTLARTPDLLQSDPALETVFASFVFVTKRLVDSFRSVMSCQAVSQICRNRMRLQIQRKCREIKNKTDKAQSRISHAEQEEDRDDWTKMTTIQKAQKWLGTCPFQNRALQRLTSISWGISLGAMVRFTPRRDPEPPTAHVESHPTYAPFLSANDANEHTFGSLSDLSPRSTWVRDFFCMFLWKLICQKRYCLCWAAFSLSPSWSASASTSVRRSQAYSAEIELTKVWTCNACENNENTWCLAFHETRIL